MTKCITVLVASMLAAGCAITPHPQPLSNDHPASADARSAPMTPPSDAFDRSDPITSPAATRPERQNVAAAYVCPMHPEVTSDEPGDCPKCGMRLVKNERYDMTGGARGGH